MTTSTPKAVLCSAIYHQDYQKETSNVKHVPALLIARLENEIMLYYHIEIPTSVQAIREYKAFLINWLPNFAISKSLSSVIDYRYNSRTKDDNHSDVSEDSEDADESNHSNNSNNENKNNYEENQDNDEETASSPTEDDHTTNDYSEDDKSILHKINSNIIKSQGTQDTKNKVIEFLSNVR